MNLIHINRKIFNKLKDDETLVKEYIGDQVMFADEDEIYEFYKDVTEAIFKVVSSNEKLIEKVGMKAYYNDDYSAKDYVSGYYYSCGKYGIMPFDWNMANETDENWSYSFNVFQVL